MSMNRIVRNIPNSITLLNLLSGVCAIILASHGAGLLGPLPAWQWACVCIGIAAVADFLDGFAARLLHAYSNLGKELDSLCDLVSFGVAPAVILFNALEAYGVTGWPLWCVVVIPLAGALRLARFNVDTRQSVSFIGLPIPANAIFWIGYCFLIADGADILVSWPLLVAVVLLESWLMISPLHIFSLKFANYSWRGNEARYLLIIAAAVFCFTLGAGGLMWLVIFYILLAQLPFARK